MAYIGSAEDSRRIRKQEEEREKQRKEFEERKRQGESNIDNAGLRQFGAGSTEVSLLADLCSFIGSQCTQGHAVACYLTSCRLQVLEAAFKNETIGLVTREEFLNKRNTLEKRLEEEAARKKRDAEQLAAGALVFLVVRARAQESLHSSTDAGGQRLTAHCLPLQLREQKGRGRRRGQRPSPDSHSLRTRNRKTLPRTNLQMQRYWKGLKCRRSVVHWWLVRSTK